MEDGKGPHGSVGRIIKYDRVTSLQQQALEQALTVLDNAYNPYSGFSVGATLISADGRLITGTNFENAAYGSTICAERAAVLQANSMGVRHFTGIAIIARGKSRKATTKVTAPCGSCRQVLWELADLWDGTLDVILSTTEKDMIILTSIREIFPLPFGPSQMLEKNDILQYRKTNQPLI